MADDKIVDLIDQLLAENDPEKQRAILAEITGLLREERDRRKKAKGTASS